MVIPFAYILRKLHLNGEKVIKKKQKQTKTSLMLFCLKELHIEFRKHNLELQIGFTKFCELCP